MILISLAVGNMLKHMALRKCHHSWGSEKARFLRNNWALKQQESEINLIRSNYCCCLFAFLNLFFKSVSTSLFLLLKHDIFMTKFGL